MKHLYTLIIFSLIAIFVMPAKGEALLLQQANPKSICDITMAHDAIVPKFIPFRESVKVGDSLKVKINLINKTSYIYKNTHVLYKVNYFDKESLENKTGGTKGAGRLIDVIYSSESYDVAPGSTTTADFVWKVPENYPAGNYRVEAYVVQNDIHVINDFARSVAYSNLNFPVVGGGDESPVTIRKEKSYFGDNASYPIEKLWSFAADDKDTRFTVVVRNSSNKDIDATYSWRVNPYGKFDDNLSFITKTDVVKLKAKSDTKIPLQISDKPSNRYHAIFNIVDNNGQKSTEIFRWMRLGSVPSLIDTYGVVKKGEFISYTKGQDQFALKKDQEYVAFACLIGGYDKTLTTLTMRIRDDKGNVIFSKEEKREVGKDITAFEYPFKTTAFSKKFDMEISTDADGLIEKATWSNDCKNNKSKDCRNPIDVYIRYLIAIIIICGLFASYYFIKNKRTHVTQNE